ncbi:MAG: lysylphosphatidylglycerol synthase domain-containing protein [Actinomycetota bacterium]
MTTGVPGAILVVVVSALAVVIIAGAVDTALVADAVDRAQSRPGPVLLALLGFGAAFVLRTVAWRLVLPGLSAGQAWSGIHVALGANHVLPLRLGEPLRVLSVVRRAGVPVDAATASTVTLRAADVLTMLAIGAVVAPTVFVDLVGPIGWVLFAVVLVVAIVGWRWLVRIAAGAGDAVQLAGPRVVALAGAAWLAESVVVWEAARWVGVDLSWRHAILIATVAVAAQIAAIAPGGFGTYEAASVAAYAAVGVDADVALVAALGAHGLKTAYSLVFGLVGLLVPAPSMLGRFRLARRSEPVASPPETAADGPVLLFMPAYNEEASVGPCVARVPDEVCGLPVEVLVVDDGSVDATVARAEEAGAEVLSLDRNRGLGAAVRVGLSEGVRRRSSVVVFCDADGEYPPEELDALVAPILKGEADYVTGSRFLGRIDHMRPHRRFGNRVLTAVLSVVARTKITDGQTGYRAFSPAAAVEAEIIHDFNYAQVLTLDLLAKGFRMAEVPISYHFRTEGESFIRLGRYLRNVVPAVYRELNAG